MEPSKRGMEPPQDLASASADSAGGPLPQSGNRPRRIPVQDILRGQKEVVIEHGAEEYRLRMTSNSKLILTK